ncbi:MAG: alginate export family protein [Desulfuromonas sp.]|nr:alginate export family protein [Desulfuromonas thiophila]
MFSDRFRLFRPRLPSALVLLGALLLASPAGAQSLLQALRQGSPTLQLLPAFEYKSVDDATHPARQLGLRSRVGYRSGEFAGFQAYLQLHNVSHAEEAFRFVQDGRVRGERDRDLIADPDGSRVQQAYLDYLAPAQTRLRLGRQEIVLDDARLIGNVDWRLNGQSFDALSLTSQPLAGLSLFAAAINQVNTITLDRLDLDHLYLFNARYRLASFASLTGYLYLLDTEERRANARDSATWGLRLAGQQAGWSYAVDLARQDDYADGENQGGRFCSLFTRYQFAPLFGLGAGYSRISGQDGSDRPFDTLFSTAHKFNGWADLFLATNGGSLWGGLEDAFVEAGGKLLGNGWLVRYHRFEASDSGNAGRPAFDGGYGDEIDIQLDRPLTDNLSVLAKYAFYNARDKRANGVANPTADTEIFWLRLNWQY